MATVLNKSSVNIRVSAFRQKETNDGHYYLLKPNQQENWDRIGGATVLVLGPPFSTKRVPRVYFIAYGETIIIYDSDLD